ncbi:N-acetylglucosamine kinase [Paenibacillus sp. TH7-28]
MLIVSVDAGQTKTAAELLDETGRLLEEWRLPPVIHYAKPGGLHSYSHIAAGVCERLNERAAGVGAGVSVGPPVSICFSLSGYHGDAAAIPEAIGQAMSGRCFELASLKVVPDYWGNWYAATRGGPGLVIISGGGTVAYGKNAAGREVRLGGWGHQLGDEGSGYWIGLAALKTALRAQAGLEPPTGLARPVLRALKGEEESVLLARCYSGEITDQDLALLVPLVNELAERQDPAALRIMKAAAGHLCELAVAARRQLGDVPVYLSGGVFKASRLMSELEAALSEAGLAGCTEVTSARPAEGIFLLALEGLEG